MLQPYVGEEGRTEFILFLIIKSWALGPHRFDLGSRGEVGGRTLGGVRLTSKSIKRLLALSSVPLGSCLREEGASEEASRASGKSDLCLLDFESAELRGLGE